MLLEEEVPADLMLMLPVTRSLQPGEMYSQVAVEAD
jgi:hypothetical protein